MVFPRVFHSVYLVDTMLAFSFSICHVSGIFC